jgi:hypothetical protein
MGVMGRIQSALVRAGLARPPFEPHAFERTMTMASHPPSAGPSIATVPHVITPTSASTLCTREGCGRPKSDPIHQVGED